MTTHLDKPLAREFLHEGEPYKVVLSPDGIRVTPKGMRRGRFYSWAELLQGSTDEAPEEASRPDPPHARVPSSVAADVLTLTRQATEAMTRAQALLQAAEVLPAELERQGRWSGEAQRGRTEGPRSDWFVEPLFSAAELADLLHVSLSMVHSLPIRSIRIGNRRRYRASDIRLYLALQDGARR